MVRKLQTNQAIGIGRKALERALSGHRLPEHGVAVVTEFDDDVVVVQYVVTGGKPEDAVLLARARVNRTTGELVSVESFVATAENDDPGPTRSE